MYDFETARPRAHMGAEKWEMMERTTGLQEGLVPFSIADMEFMAAPEIVEAMHQAADFAVYGYTVADGRFCRAVGDWMARRHGWAVEKEWLMQTYGVVSAMISVVYALTQPGEGVIYQPPVYPPFRSVVERTGRTPVENPLREVDGRYEMDLEGLEELAARPDVKLLLLCSPHNPVGRVWTREELAAVSDICARHGVAVFADEIHCDFVYAPHVHVPYATVSPEAARHSVTAVSASKTFNLAGLSTANLIIPDEGLRAACRKAMECHTGQFINYFGLAATTAAYEKGEAWLEELKEVLQRNAQLCRDILARDFPAARVFPLEGTYLLWVDFNCLGLSAGELEDYMVHEAGLCLDEGHIFGPEGAGFERINLACPWRFLERGLERLRLAAERRGLRG